MQHLRGDERVLVIAEDKEVNEKVLKGYISTPDGQKVQCSVKLSPYDDRLCDLRGEIRIPKQYLAEFGRNPNGFEFRDPSGSKYDQFPSPVFHGIPMECTDGEIVVLVNSKDMAEQDGAVL